MSRQDPGAATGAGVYTRDPDCECGCPAALHAYGRRDGQSVRTACSSSYCDCRLYRAKLVDRAKPARCPVCAAHWDAIEAARRLS